MQKLNVSNSPNEVVDFVVSFGHIFNQVFADFQRKNDAQIKTVPKAYVKSKAWNLDNDYDKHSYQLEEALRQGDEDVAALDAKILTWKKEIEVLQKKVHEAENRNKALWKVNKQQIDEESFIDI